MRRPGASWALAAALVALIVLQLAGGVWSDLGRVSVSGALITAVAVLAGFALPDQRGILAGLGLSAAGVAHALATTETPTVLLLGLVVLWWLPAAGLALAWRDDDERREAPPLGSPASGGATARRATGTGAALAACAVIAAFAALAATVVRPGGGVGGSGGDRSWGDVARRGRPPTSLGIYQSADRLDTGRRFQLSDEIVMRVRADRPDFWRGTTYDHWDGRTWTRTPFTFGQGDGSDLVDLEATPVPSEDLVQQYEIVSGGSDLLFGAYRVSQVVPPAGRLRSEADGTTTVPRPLGPGARYAVVSRRPVVTDDVLRAAEPLAAPVPDEVADRYLRLPTQADRVVELARTVTASAPTTFDKVRALEAWLGANTTYTLDIPPLPDGADAVDRFLFVDRRGFCEQIATSLAVLLRSVGVPARLGVGYAPGVRSWGSDAYTVRARDAHAWVEVWFPGAGWQVFDPTAQVPLSGDPVAEPGRQLAGRLIVVLGALGVAAGAVVVVMALRRRHRRAWSHLVLQRLTAAGTRRGRPRRPTETVAEYLDVLAREVLGDPRLADVARAIDRATFGADGPDASETRRMDALVKEILAAAPRPSRRGRRGRGGRPVANGLSQDADQLTAV